MKKNIFLVFVLITNVTCFAGIYRAGEITYRHITSLEYEITVTTYTDLLDSSDSHEITVYFGDGTSEIFPRTLKIDLPDESSKNVYVGQHIYSAPGTFIVSIEEPCRTSGINNIPNSCNTFFHIESQITINAFLGYNDSPVFLNPPIGIAYIDSIFIYNPGVNDIDGDSISYKLIPCSGESPILGYTYPSASNIFSLDSMTGDLTWDSPISVGDYNIAILIQEWRQGVLIGYVIRDMQIHVENASGIEGFSKSLLFNIFPNPSHDKLYINSKANKWTMVEIIDLLGETVLFSTLNDDQIVEIGEIPTGLYLLRLTDKKRTQTIKFIKE